MNVVILQGRLTSNPEVRYGQDAKRIQTMMKGS